MTTKMKGLLKGLRYISQIFDNVDKEPEMQIGLPTDVKHVAHIGWDGLSVNTPSWMNEFNTNPELSSGSLNSISEVLEKSVVQTVRGRNSRYTTRKFCRYAKIIEVSSITGFPFTKPIPDPTSTRFTKAIQAPPALQVLQLILQPEIQRALPAHQGDTTRV
ncbi:hypothetical protein L1049_016020 [Liquidambar formosana]|uniref:CRIB domain-containing protein n=1 Tax=Liquidambar formosana TaxID=63359 RepID=A0AAP0S5R2_LIQFO